MSKKTTDTFRLKPKHLILAAFFVSIVAVGALIVGVIGTLNPKNARQNTQESQVRTAPKEEGVEVWRPNGTVEPKKIMTGSDNPPAENDIDKQDAAASRNPAIPPQNRPDSRRTKTTGETDGKTAERPAPKPSEPAKRTETQTTPAAESKPKAEPKPDTHTEPPAEPKPAPRPTPKPVQPKSQPKDVMDNLF